MCFPIHLGNFSLTRAFLRNVKIDFRIREFFGGGIFLVTVGLTPHAH